MKKIITVFAILLYAFPVNAAHEHSMQQKMQNEFTESKRKQVSKQVKIELLNILKENEKLKTAFSTYNPNEIEVAANSVIEAMNKLSDESIAKKLAFSKKKLDLIGAEQTEQQNKDDYNIISMALIYIIDNYDVGSTYNAYYCPMAKKKWIQNSKKMKEVNNPYMSNMKSCGDMITNY